MRDGIDEYTLLCEKCGYVTEGLARDGQCPECGKPVAESLPERRDQVPGMWACLRSPFRSLDSMAIESRTDSFTRMMRRCLVAGAFVCFAPAITFAPAWFVSGGIVEVLAKTSMAAMIGIFALIFVVFALVFFTEIEGFGLRFLGRRREYRISDAVSMTIVSHGCVGWLIGSFGWTVGLLLVGFAEVLFSLQESTVLVDRIRALGLSFAIMGLVAGFLIFEMFAYLGLSRCGFANRVRRADGASEPIDELQRDD